MSYEESSKGHPEKTLILTLQVYSPNSQVPLSQTSQLSNVL